MISDPPFSQLDLICCRNLLIYLKMDLQQKIISLFHFSLYQHGFLLLGTAETVGRHEDLFETIDKGGRIFQSIGRSRHDKLSLPSSHMGPRREFEFPTRPLPPKRPTQLAQQALLALISPSAVLIDRQWRILYISGNVNAYLVHQEGVPSDDLLRKIVPNLRSQLRAAVHQAYKEKTAVSVVGRVQRPSGIRQIRINVQLIPNEQSQDDFALVLFDEAVEDETRNGDRIGRSSTDPARDTSVSEQPLSQLDESSLISQLESEL